jgi:uncharacterized protein YbjT (DUF2867 family)
MKIFVSGAAGFQGGNITQELLDNGHKVTTLKQSKTGTQVRADIDIIAGGLQNISALNEALEGVDAAVYMFPLIFDLKLAKEYTKNFISAAKQQKVPLIVFNTGFDLPALNHELLAINLKVEIKQLLDASGLNVITLVPDVYIDNLAAPWSIPVILEHNILPYPVASNSKIPWVSHADLAKYVTSAIEKPELAGQVIPIGGALFTGEEIAEVISSEIGKKINFVSLTAEDFEQQISPTFGELAGREISNLYRYITHNRADLVTKDFKKSQEILGVTPQSLIGWVKSVKWELTT